MATQRGKWLTLEGVDGAGKTTQLTWLATYLRAAGAPLDVSREPGGTPVSEHIRALVLHQEMTPETEALLMFAARQQHLVERIRPQLAAGQWMLCDRFSDATFAYQGGGRGVSLDKLAALEAWVHPQEQPDLTLLLDLPPEVSLRRVHAGRSPDRFEQQGLAFFTSVRQVYLARAAADPQRIHVVNADGTVAEVQQRLRAVLDPWLAVAQL